MKSRKYWIRIHNKKPADLTSTSEQHTFITINRSDRSETSQRTSTLHPPPSAMLDEREQAIHPVVAECVQHNARASSSPPLPVSLLSSSTTYRSPNPSPNPPTNPTLSTDNIQHSLPDRLLIRRRSRHPRLRVLHRLPLLPARHAVRLHPHLLLPGRGAAVAVFPVAVLRPVDCRRVWGAE